MADGAEQAVKRVTLRDKVLAHLDAQTDPVTREHIAQQLGTGALDALDGLVYEGRVQRRKTFTKGRPYEHIALGRTWPEHKVSPTDAARRKMEQSRARREQILGRPIVANAVLRLEQAAKRAQLADELALNQTPQESRNPWPFYDQKFLPYVRFMDAKMRRRYVRTAKIYGHAVPKEYRDE